MYIQTYLSQYFTLLPGRITIRRERILPERRYASGVYAIDPLPVCSSVRSPQAVVVSKRPADRAHFWRIGYPLCILHCVGREFGYLQTSLWTCVPNSGLTKISPRHVDLRKCCQLSYHTDHLGLL